MLHALRISRHWDVDRMARELRRASDEPLAAHHALVRMVRSWESGGHKVSERYLLLYHRVFPGEWSLNGDATELTPDPAAVLERARRVPGDDVIAEIEDPAVRAVLADMREQVNVLSKLLKELLGEPDE
jgi:hypothetical protein